MEAVYVFLFLTSSIAYQSINRLGQLIFLKILTEFMYTREGIQFAIHNVKVVHIKPINFGHRLHLIDITYGPDNVILVCG